MSVIFSTQIMPSAEATCAYRTFNDITDSIYAGHWSYKIIDDYFALFSFTPTSSGQYLQVGGNTDSGKNDIGFNFNFPIRSFTVAIQLFPEVSTL